MDAARQRFDGDDMIPQPNSAMKGIWRCSGKSAPSMGPSKTLWQSQTLERGGRQGLRVSHIDVIGHRNLSSSCFIRPRCVLAN